MNTTLDACDSVLYRALSSVWMEALGLENAVDPNAPFIEIGGISIAAEQIASRARELCATKVTGSDILRHNFSLNDLLQHIASADSTTQAPGHN